MKFASVAPGLGGAQLETRKALLLIDLQNDFVDRAGKLFVSNTADFLPKLPTLISLFRTKGDVFFIKTEYAGPRSIYSDATGGYGLVLKSNVASKQPSVHADEAPGKIEHHAQTPPSEASMIAGGKLASDVEAFLTPPYNTQASWSQCCLPGSSGSSWPDVLSSSIEQNTDMQIVKSHYSPFHDASFLLHLRMQLVTELYICGSLSNISVYATVIDAVSHGMAVTIVEDCVGYRDECCHLETMRQMADQMGASGIDYQELMDDLAGLLGDVVHEDDFDTRYDVTFQHGLRSQRKTDPKEKTSAWLSSLEQSTSDTIEPEPSFHKSLLQSGFAAAYSSGNVQQNTESSSDIGRQRQQTPDSPPRKRPFKDLESDARDHKTVNTRRRASHEGHIGENQRVSSTRARRRHPQAKDSRRSPTPHLDTRPQLESKSTSDIPHTVSSQIASPLVQKKLDTRRETEMEETTAQASDGPMLKQKRPQTRSTKAKKAIPAATFESGDVIVSDSTIIYDVLPEDLSAIIFEKLHAEVQWEKMYHRSGEVPRLVAVQGETSPTKVPIYRHPSDSPPPLLPFTPHVQTIRTAAEKLVGHSLNHVLIQLYRTPEDNISEHSDKTLDIRKGSKIVNYSAGAMRTMILRSKRSEMSTLDVDLKATGATSTDHMAPGPPRPALRVPMPHNSLFVLGPETNQSHLHSIRADRRPSSLRSKDEQAYSGARISLTFRDIATFINPEGEKIWGQGATRKTEGHAARIMVGRGAEMEYEKMIRAFGQENHQSADWSWEEWYGHGFDVVESPEVVGTSWEDGRRAKASDALARKIQPAGEEALKIDTKLYSLTEDADGETQAK
jgi:nicotinamidase-related amidase